MADSLYDQLPTPTVPDLSDQIEHTTELIGRGGYGSVYKGRWLDTAPNPTPAIIAIKIIDLMPLKDEVKCKRRIKLITRELSIWCSIKHENILPLLGTALINDDANIPAFICPWMENGNAKEFCLRNPRFPPVLILYGIINGLHYLHTFQPEIVHGDIKAVNVLINNRCEACLCDFGLSRFLTDSTQWKTTATVAGGTARWMAPELMTGETSTPTKESDIYAYAMTCYEILSGDVPFKSISNEMALLLKVMKGERPERIESLHSDFLWDIITRCWEQEPKDRPRSEIVLELLWPKVDQKKVEESLAKFRENEMALAKVEKELTVLKEKMARAEENMQALKEENENALEDARRDSAEKERELNSLNASLQRSESAVQLLENRVEELERGNHDAEERFERIANESQVLREQLEENAAMHQAESTEIRREVERAKEDSRLLREDLTSLRHTNSSLLEEIESLKQAGRARDMNAAATQQAQQNDIAMVHERLARTVAELRHDMTMLRR